MSKHDSKTKVASNRLTRPYGGARYRATFVIATEGEKTEPSYFEWISSHFQHTVIRILKPKNSAPKHVLQRMKNHLKQNNVRENDEAWLVVDQDEWKLEALNVLKNWSEQRDNYGFALSVPNFEYWLLLHFAKDPIIQPHEDCLSQLRRYWPEYDKYIPLDGGKLTITMVDSAISRAKHDANQTRNNNWSNHIGSTTVYKLVERIMHANEKYDLLDTQ